MSLPKLGRATLITLTLAAPPALSAQDSPATGDLWEVTSSMSMEGVDFAIPGQRRQQCTPREWTRPPVGGMNPEEECVISDFLREGEKISWTSACSGPPASTGRGVITRHSAESWSGSILFASEEGNMKIELTGNRIGECELP